MPRSLWWITTLTALLWTNSLLGAVSAQFPSPPSSDTIYDYWYGYPYMEVGGDNVLGYRSSSGLPAVNALSVEVGVDQTYLYCDTYLDFYFDGDYIGYAYLDPLYYWTQITDSITVDLTNAASHTVQMVLYWDADWCSYPYYYSWIELDDVYSTITMDLVGADSDGDGYYATTYYGDDCNDNDASVHPGASESCNGADDDCDGSVDENVQSVYYRDADGDGYGSAGTTTYACSAPPGYVSGAGDCNDQASGINPGAAEVCNGVDDDCDDKVDEGVKTTYYRDQDGDNYGSSSGTTQACSQPSGYSSASGDCNDTDSAIHPGASESCDGQDNDCDGSVDEGVQTTFYRDADEDGFGTTSQTTLACVAPAGYTNQPGDCDDSSATTYPSAPERCDGADNDCDGLTDEGVLLIWYPDSDGDGYGVVSQTQAGCSQPDGYSAQSGDCNDDVATVYPGATEVCNGVDDDCDDGQAGGGVDEGVKETFYQDGDGDGHGDSSQTAQACSSPEGYVITSDDCDDGDSGVHPGASEVCDGKDNDCDGTTDEGVQLTWYEDNDEDGFGSSQTTSACTQPSGYADSSGDCDDDDPLVNPAGTEVCNSKDDDCDDGQPGGGVDEGVKETWYQDADDDGYGTGVTALACSAPAGFAGSSGDCNDDDPLVNPSAVEVCNGVDDDCDGATDEGLLSTYYEDGDDDGYGTASSTVQACSPPAGFVATAGDCDDTSAGINPGAEEICDSTPGSPGIDNDCDGAIDEGVQSSYYQDFDGDGYGVGSVVQLACTVPDGHAERSGDCNDSDPGINPAAEETCDGRDNNCNGATDEGVTNTFYADADQDGFGDPLRPANACSVPSGYVVVDSPDAFDCNDVDATTYPGAQEVCDGRDNDCDGDIDEEARIPYYQDDDGDNYGATDQVVYACERPAGYAADGSDCDDNDPSVHPGAREDCDGRDNDCDGMVDEDVTSVFYADRDGDGHGTPDDSVRTCTRPDGYVSSGSDCDDTDPEVFPGALEICNERDDNCNGDVDEEVQDTWYADLDDDGFGDPDNITEACTRPDGYLDNATDCNDEAAAIYPGATEICADGIDQNCDSYDPSCDQVDNDGDGYSEIDGDCDDDNPQANPGALETCEPGAQTEGVDNDCNGIVDDVDNDGDDFVDLACGGTDCDDQDPRVNPNVEETCDGLDNDCDSQVDNVDQDGDTYDALSCGGDDCDDQAPLVNPASQETCDGLDNDCDSQVDNVDQDGDTYVALSCGGDDCDDQDPAVNPGAVEIVNGQDDNCDGFPDEGTDASDDDGDGYSEDAGDCNDDEASVNPGAEEVPDDGVDNDCDGSIDETPDTPTPSPADTPVPGPDDTPWPDTTPGPDDTPWLDTTPGLDDTPWLDTTPGPDDTPWLDTTPGPDDTPRPQDTPWPDATPGPDDSPTIEDTPGEAPPDASGTPNPDPVGGDGCSCRIEGPHRSSSRPGGAPLVLLALGVLVLRARRRHR